jgi:hypothetical protein
MAITTRPRLLALALAAIAAGPAAADEPVPPAPAAPDAPDATAAPDAAPAAPAPAPDTPPAPAPSPPVPAPDAPPSTPAPAPDAPLGITASLTGSLQLQDEDDQRTTLMVASVTYTRPRWPSLYARLGWVHDTAAAASGVSDLLLGASRPFALPRSFKLEPRFAVILPIGSGRGNDADPSVMRALVIGTDWGGPMFAPNHLTLSAGLRLSFSRGRLFALADAALNRAMRVAGEDLDPLGPTVTFSPSKLVVGAAVSAAFAVYGGVAETRYWGSPGFVEADPPARDDHYAFVGVDWTHDLGGKQLQIGLLYSLAFDPPKSRRDFQVAEISTALSF